MADLRCFLPVCHGGGEEKKFTKDGLKRLISCANARGDAGRAGQAPGNY